MNDAAETLRRYSAAALKQIASARFQDTKLPNAEMVRVLAKVLWHPRELDKILATLSPAQHTALQRAKQYGGRHLLPELLDAQLAFDGVRDARTVLHSLLRLGLLVYDEGGAIAGALWPGQTTSSYYSVPPRLCLPEPVAERVEVPPDLGRLPLEPCHEAWDTVEEVSFSALQRDLYQFLLYLRENRVRLLKSGLPSKRDFARINERLTQPDDLEGVATFEETFRLRFLERLLTYAGLIEVCDGEVRATAKAEGFFRQQEPEQARTLLEAWVPFVEWNEFDLIPWIEILTYESAAWGSSDYPRHDRFPQARRDILELLDRERPRGEWFSVSSLVASMQRYKLGFLIPNRGVARPGYSYRSRDRDEPPLYYGFRPRGGQYHERFSKREHWGMVEGGYLAMVLVWPLRWLGIVRLGMKDGKVVAFQVTELGAAALGWTDAAAWAPPAAARALIVQPNFEIVAMLESTGFGLLAELERFAERVTLDKAAVYRLTRESVCRGLQAGLTLDEIGGMLRDRGGMPLPQNVEFTLREWEQLFQRIRVHRRAAVLEAETADELEGWLAKLDPRGVRRLSPTAALIDRSAVARLLQRSKATGRSVAWHDYAETTNDTFQFVDAREIDVRPGRLSPLLEHRLGRVAVPVPAAGSEAGKGARFRLDPERTRAAAAALGLDALVRFLEQGSNQPLSPDTRLTIEGWAGKFPTLGLGKLTVLTAPKAETMDMLLRVPELASRLRRLAPTVVLLQEGDAAELRKALEARGVTLAEGADLDSVLARGAEPEETSLLFVRPKRRREIIEEAILLQRRLLIGWQNWNSTRLVIHEVDPIKILETGGQGTLVGYSHREKYQMQFAIQQIQGICLTEQPVEPHPKK